MTGVEQQMYFEFVKLYVLDQQQLQIARKLGQLCEKLAVRQEAYEVWL